MARTRDESEALAWRTWQLVGEGRVADGLDILDDAGTWWDMATRADGPMARMKALPAEAFVLVPIEFTLVGSIVEDCRVALMVESFAELPDGGKYNNVYTFITTLPDKDVIVTVREYADRLVRTERGWRIKHRMIKERRYFDDDYRPWTLLEADW